LRPRAEEKHPLRGPLAVVGKFIATAFMGGFVSLVVLVFFQSYAFQACWEEPWPHLLWVIPLFGGILGVFWFDWMLEAARDIFERCFGVDR